MTRWPNFFIIGGGRSGGTSLRQYLRKHPDIYMPSYQEPDFFCQVDPEAPLLRHRTRRVVTDEEVYLQLFEDAGTASAIGEASPRYLWHERAPQRIKEKIPHARFIIVLREPISRAYSHYLSEIQIGRQRGSFYEALIEDEACPRKEFGFCHLYLQLGLYYEQVKRCLDTFGSEQVRIFLFDDLLADTHGFVRDVCAFLDVPFYDGTFFDPGRAHNTFALPRNAIFSWLVRTYKVRSLAASLFPREWLVPLRDRFLLAERPKPPMDPKAREFLIPAYRDDILKLQDLIRQDLGGWLLQYNSLPRYSEGDY